MVHRVRALLSRSLLLVAPKALVTTRIMNILVTCFAHLWQQDLLIVSQAIAGLLDLLTQGVVANALGVKLLHHLTVPVSCQCRGCPSIGRGGCGIG
jgi:hypothetical protein